MHRTAPSLLLTTDSETSTDQERDSPWEVGTVHRQHRGNKNGQETGNVITSEQSKCPFFGATNVVKSGSRLRTSARKPEKLKSRRPGFGKGRWSGG